MNINSISEWEYYSQSSEPEEEEKQQTTEQKTKTEDKKSVSDDPGPVRRQETASLIASAGREPEKGVTGAPAPSPDIDKIKSDRGRDKQGGETRKDRSTNATAPPSKSQLSDNNALRSDHEPSKLKVETKPDLPPKKSTAVERSGSTLATTEPVLRPKSILPEKTKIEESMKPHLSDKSVAKSSPTLPQKSAQKSNETSPVSQVTTLSSDKPPSTLSTSKPKSTTDSTLKSSSNLMVKSSGDSAIQSAPVINKNATQVDNKLLQKDASKVSKTTLEPKHSEKVQPSSKPTADKPLKAVANDKETNKTRPNSSVGKTLKPITSDEASKPKPNADKPSKPLHFADKPPKPVSNLEEPSKTTRSADKTKLDNCVDKLSKSIETVDKPSKPLTSTDKPAKPCQDKPSHSVVKANAQPKIVPPPASTKPSTSVQSSNTASKPVEVSSSKAAEMSTKTTQPVLASSLSAASAAAKLVPAPFSAASQSSKSDIKTSQILESLDSWEKPIQDLLNSSSKEEVAKPKSGNKSSATVSHNELLVVDPRVGRNDVLR